MWQRRADRRQSPSPETPVSFGIVEPGTTTLRLLVVEVASGQATVLGWAEGAGWSGPHTDRARLLDVCQKALVQAEGMAQSMGERWLLPDQILVGLPTSRLRARAWSVAQRRSRPERPVEEREIEGLLERTLRLAVSRLRSDVPNEAAWVLLDAVPVAMTVDGRGVTDPIGFRGREIGATVFAALAETEAIQGWGWVAHELEFSTLTLTATPLALAMSLPGTHGILVDVGGTTTDLIWCRAGRPALIDSLDGGGNTLTDLLVRQWNLSPDRAERLKRAYSGGRLVANAQAQVQEVLLPGLQAWLEGTEGALARLNQDEPLPEHLFLLGGGSAMAEITDAVRSLAWSTRLQFARYPQVSRLRPTDVPNVVNRTVLGLQMGDVSALALAAWLAAQQRVPDRPARILSELCQA